MGRKAQGGGTPADLGKKLEVLLDPGEQEQLTSICTISMVKEDELLRRFVLDGIRREVSAILQQYALAVQVSIDQAAGRFVRRASEVDLNPPDLQGTLADQYPPGSAQAREKCEGTCSGKCTLAQPDLDPGQLTQAAISGTLTGRINSTSGNLTEVRRVQAQSEATLADYVFCTENGLRGGEADEESLQKKQGTPTADQYPEHSGHSQGTNTCPAEASDSSRPFERISTTTRALERIEDDEQFN